MHMHVLYNMKPDQIFDSGLVFGWHYAYFEQVVSMRKQQHKNHISNNNLKVYINLGFQVFKRNVTFGFFSEYSHK